MELQCGGEGLASIVSRVSEKTLIVEGMVTNASAKRATNAGALTTFEVTAGD